MGMGRRFVLLASTVLAALLAGGAALVALGGTAQAAFPGNNGEIAFDGTRNGNTGIYTMRPDGSNVQLATGGPGHWTFPEWSPDGSKIAFSRSDGHDQEIFVKDLGSGTLAQITDNHNNYDPDYPEEDYEINDVDPAWSPDGSKIVFVRRYEISGIGTCHYLYVANSDGSDQRNLMGIYCGGTMHGPAWSPDGSKIAYEYNDGDFSSIQVVDANGKNPRNLSGVPADSASIVSDGDPDWSPDGKRLVYTSVEMPDFVEVGRDVWVTNADGSNKTRLTDGPEAESSAEWSPDGSKVAFRRTGTQGDNDVWTMNRDGSGQRNLTNSPENEGYLDWRPSCTVRGTPANDALAGTSSKDMICGMGGNDAIKGLGGDDSLDSRDGVSGNDSSNGGPDADACARDAAEKSVVYCER